MVSILPPAPPRQQAPLPPNVFLKRQLDRVPGSLAQGAVDGRRSPKQPCPFLDPFQAKVAVGDLPEIGANTPLLHLNENVPVPAGNVIKGGESFCNATTWF